MPSEGGDWSEHNYSHLWHDKFGKVSRPMYQVKFSNTSHECWYLALIDSGSDRIMINSDFAEILGINLGLCKEVEVGGIGAAKGRICDVSLEIEEFNIKENVTAIFVDKLPFSALLGQNDFFSWFNVRFEKAKGKFHLRKTN